MSEQTFEAESVEAALEKAASALGVDPGELEHDVVEKKQDFWGGGDSYVIKAWQRAEPDTVDGPPPATDEGDEPAPEERPEEAPSAAEPDDVQPGGETEAQPAAVLEPATRAVEPEQELPAGAAEQGAEAPADAAADTGGDAPHDAPESAPIGEEPSAAAGEASPEVRPAARGAASGFDPAAEGQVEPEQISGLLAQIFHDMEFDCTVEVQEDDEGFSATVSGADKEELLEGNGRCLSALELLVNNAFRNRMSRGDKIRVDAGNFRSRRDQELTDLAYQVAHSAKESGETQETQELNPYERRLVHLALAEDQAVTTKSRGSGFLKNVQVIPEQQGRGRGRRR